MTDLGYEFLGLVTNDKRGQNQGDHQVAVLRAPDKRNVLVARGTQVEDNFSLSELLDDNNTDLTDYYTFSGFELPSIMLNQIIRMLDKDQPTDIYGHSKGGAEAHTMIDSIKPSRVVSFGAPCCATKEYWNTEQVKDTELYRVVAVGDFAPGWGLDSGGYQPYPCVILQDNVEPTWGFKPVYKTLLEGGLGPHSITDSYIRLLNA